MKTYIEPEIDIVYLKPESALLAGSGVQDSLGDEYNDGDESYSPSLGLWEE
ncbi:MAG: hypothetical protein IJ544_01970 [Prevotella sp.]|nr:hypothetical protein [Prevotella sp.]